MSQREQLRGASRIVMQVASIALAGASDKGLSLSVLGSLVDQVHQLASKGVQVDILFSGDQHACEQACKSVKALMQLKEPALTTEPFVNVYAKEAAIAADVAKANSAQLLVYLSHTSGVPSGKQGKVLATFVPGAVHLDAAHSCQPGKSLVESAWQAATSGGCPVIMAKASEPDVLARIVAGEAVGTLFDAAAAEAAAAPHANGAGSSSAHEMAVRARAASRKLQALPTAERVAMLNRVADALLAQQELILAENKKDVEESQGKISDSLLQRLILKPPKIALLAEGIRAIAAQEEPVGRLLKRTEVAEGLVLDKITAPIGVLLIIFEARPDALPQIASLALRSGNGLLLKGGKEATRSNSMLHRIIVEAIGPIGADLISLVQTREEINDLLSLDDVIDLVIPRGGNALVSYIQRNTKIPVLGHADGICHIYVDEQADLDTAIKVIVDAKVDYPAACNAVEKVLVHSSWVQRGGLAQIKDALEAAGVQLFAGERAGNLSLPAAPSSHYEYSALACTLEVVDNMQQAIDHIHAYGSSHTDAIITQNKETAEQFLRAVDSACVMHNASTRFADGFRFGLGAEVGISTSRIHARGPVGVEGLLTTKWQLRGSGQIVAKDQGVAYTHKQLPLA